jgi:hypothetical protein
VCCREDLDVSDTRTLVFPVTCTVLLHSRFFNPTDFFHLPYKYINISTKKL